MTTNQKMEVMNKAGYFPTEQELANNTVDELYEEFIAETMDEISEVDAPETTEQPVAEEVKPFADMTKEQLIADKSITKKVIVAELNALGVEVKVGKKTLRETLIEKWFKEMHKPQPEETESAAKETVATEEPVIPSEPEQPVNPFNNAVKPDIPQDTAPIPQDTLPTPDDTPATQNKSKFKVKPAKNLGEVIDYILWKQHTADKVYSKDFVSAAVIKDYVKQKALGLPTGKDVPFTDDEMTKINSCIKKLVEMNAFKPVYRTGTQELVGYSIRYAYVCRYYAGKKFDVIYTSKKIDYHIDITSGFYASMNNCKPMKLTEKFAEELVKYGRLTGIVNRDTCEVTRFGAEQK